MCFSHPSLVSNKNIQWSTVDWKSVCGLSLNATRKQKHCCSTSPWVLKYLCLYTSINSELLIYEGKWASPFQTADNQMRKCGNKSWINNEWICPRFFCLQTRLQPKLSILCWGKKKKKVLISSSSVLKVFLNSYSIQSHVDINNEKKYSILKFYMHFRVSKLFSLYLKKISLRSFLLFIFSVFFP